MRHMFILVLALLANLAVAQQELQPGLTYTARANLNSRYYGINLTVPAGFSGSYRDEATQVLSLTDTGQNVLILAILQHGVSQLEHQRLLTQALPVSDGLTLEPRGAPQGQGNRLSTTYGASNGASGLGIVTRAQTGSSLFALGIAAPGFERAMQQAVQGLVSSLKFGAAQATQGDSKLRGQWTALLGGKTWQRVASSNNNSLNGAGASSSDARLTLCQNRSFTYVAQSSVFVSTPGDFGSSASSSSEDRLEGRWSVELVTPTSAVLALTDENGLQRRFALVLRGNTLLVNGITWNPSGAGC